MCRCLFVIGVASLTVACLQDSNLHLADGPSQGEKTYSLTTEGVRPKKLEAQYLPNLIQVHPKVISGGLPEGDAAFRELQTLGVKTVISVDGAKPDVETAAKFGLRYVHLPHGYDGIPDVRAKELAKAVRDLDGRIYIHCHRGKHRSPAAASVACVIASLLSPADGLSVLALAGTSQKYRGLYQSAAEAKPVEKALLDEFRVEFRDVAVLPPMAEAMVAIEHTHDQLMEIGAAGWRTPADHPDLEPVHEALLMREHFIELLRTDEVEQKPEGFRELLRDSETAAQELENGLRDWKLAEGQETPPEALGRFAHRISGNCNTCHQKYRDVPLCKK